MSSFEFTFPLQPVAKGRPRFTRQGRAYTPAKTRKAEQDLRYFIAREWGDRAPLEGALKLYAKFTFQRPPSVKASKRPHHIVKPDASNVLKAIEDSAIGLLFRDDAQLVLVTAEKAYGERPSIYLHVSEVE